MHKELEMKLNILLDDKNLTEVEYAKYLPLYSQENAPLQKWSAQLHAQFFYFLEVLKRASVSMDGRYYLRAHLSGEFKKIIHKILEVNKLFKQSNEEFIIEKYNQTINDLNEMIRIRNGSYISKNIYKSATELSALNPIFNISNSTQTKVLSYNYNRTLIGEGAFANVSKYHDEYYDCYFAVKKLKKNTNSLDAKRFIEEFNYMKNNQHPNILFVYKFDKANMEYIMEYCDFDLKKYISKNDKLTKNARFKIIMQILNVLSYLHRKQVLHRDISIKNILIKLQGNIPVVKLSDFGLIKLKDSHLTKSNETMKGAIQDPTLNKFSDYNVLSEIYSIGYIINYVLYGKEGLQNFEIIKKCTSINIDDRFKSVDEIIEYIKKLH